ncbi:MAG: hypothetical protein B6A08_03470 [Sorangiineae bacterium NIC37A_2]|nr:MAG: hypothetical protein B6A08_03470 [Sorangiineae bacterium NIC37A_2]
MEPSGPLDDTSQYFGRNVTALRALVVRAPSQGVDPKPTAPRQVEDKLEGSGALWTILPARHGLLGRSP